MPSIRTGDRCVRNQGQALTGTVVDHNQDAHATAVDELVGSRPPRGLKAVISRLNFAMPIAGFNAGVIASSDLSVIPSHLIAANVAQHALAAIELSGANSRVFSGEHWFVRDRKSPRVAFEQGTVGFGHVVVTGFAACIASAAKIVAVSDVSSCD